MKTAFYEPPPPTVYWPTMSAYIGVGSGTNSIRGVIYVVRSERTGTEAFLNEMRQAVWSVSSEPARGAAHDARPLRAIARADVVHARDAGDRRIHGAALGVVGIYGVISYAVSQRRREIGIRAALGAQQRDLKRMFVRHGLGAGGSRRRHWTRGGGGA